MILAGGASRRFGSPKGFAQLNGVRLIDLVLERLRAQTRAEIALNAGAKSAYGALDLPLIPDSHTGQPGPLAGLYAAMDWAASLGYERVATVPVDLPFLPTDFITRLNAADAPAIAQSQERAHPVCGLWPVSLKDELGRQIEAGMRAAHIWATHCQAKPVHFPLDEKGRDPFFNINTPDDLTAAERA